MWHPRHVRNPKGRGGDSFSVCLTPCCLPPCHPAYSFVQTHARQETTLEFVVISDQKVVIEVLLVVVVVAMLVVEESVVGE